MSTSASLRVKRATEVQSSRRNLKSRLHADKRARLPSPDATPHPPGRQGSWSSGGGAGLQARADHRSSPGPNKLGPMAGISTERLIMRGWRESDLEPWAAMNADPEVRKYLGPLLTFEQASAWALNFQDDLDRYGFGFWAVEVRASGEFIGFTGLGIVEDGMPVTGVEIGWRLARPAGATVTPPRQRWPRCEYGFGVMGRPEIVAVTMARNLRSRAVMQRIGMTSDPAEDFDDPDVDQAQLRRHVVYRKLSGLPGLTGPALAGLPALVPPASGAGAGCGPSRGAGDRTTRLAPRPRPRLSRRRLAHDRPASPQSAARPERSAPPWR